MGFRHTFSAIGIKSSQPPYYYLVQKKCPLFEFPSFLLPTHLHRPADAQPIGPVRTSLNKLSSLSFD